MQVNIVYNKQRRDTKIQKKKPQFVRLRLLYRNARQIILPGIKGVDRGC